MFEGYCLTVDLPFSYAGETVAVIPQGPLPQPACAHGPMAELERIEIPGCVHDVFTSSEAKARELVNRKLIDVLEVVESRWGANKVSFGSHDDLFILSINSNYEFFPHGSIDTSVLSTEVCRRYLNDLKLIIDLGRAVCDATADLAGRNTNSNKISSVESSRE